MEIHCRHFKGNTPCTLSDHCTWTCEHRDVPSERYIVIQTGGISKNLQSTPLLEAIKIKSPKSHITWICDQDSLPLFENNPFVDRKLGYGHSDLLALQALKFDYAINLSPSLEAAGLLKSIEYDELSGFRVDSRSGAILPANNSAKYIWEMYSKPGVRFFNNTQSYSHRLLEAVGFSSENMEYVLGLSDDELLLSEQRRSIWTQNNQFVIGIYPGRSDESPYSSLSIENHRNLIRKMNQDFPTMPIVILGLKCDEARNQKIVEGLPAYLSTGQDVRDLICSLNACDVIVAGESAGLHGAIALKKWVVSWFGPTCLQEVNLFERGVKLQSPVACSPCLKKSCTKSTMCYDRVKIQDIIDGVKEGLDWKPSLYKQPLSEMHF